MSDLSIAATPGEPLCAWFSAERQVAGVREQRFECTSHGDRVSGKLWRPEARAEHPLVLAVHELAHAASDPSLEAAARCWAASGWATAAVDLPLHGERHNAKLSRRAIAAAGDAGAIASDRELWRGLVAQSVRDLARALDALLASDGFDAAGIASVAFGSSAPIARAHANLDARVRCVAAIGTEPASEAESREHAKALSWLARPDDLIPFLAAARDRS